MAPRRLSKAQKETLKLLTKCVYSKINEARAADVRRIVAEEMHLNNWRVSLLKLQEQGLLVVRKPDDELYINLTPKGFDKGVELLKAEQFTKEKEKDNGRSGC